MLATNTPEAWREALDAEAERLLAQAGIEEPPIDILHVAAVLGFVVAVDTRLGVRARHVQLAADDEEDETSAILLRPEPRIERRHWAVAHEIGEHHVHAVFARLGLDADVVAPPTREQTANALANRLLLPTLWFLADGFKLRWDLGALKGRYRTASHELIARRMLEMDPPAIMTMIDQTEPKFRRGNMAGPVPRLMDLERILCHSAHHTGKIQQDRDRRFWVRVWPIHEGKWKREIIRTELRDEDFDDGAQSDF